MREPYKKDTYLNYFDKKQRKNYRSNIKPISIYCTQKLNCKSFNNRNPSNIYFIFKENRYMDENAVPIIC